MQLSVKSRRELMNSLGERYRAGSRDAKCRILDEFVAITGYHRKHAIRLLRLRSVAEVSTARARPRHYGDAVAEALVVLWEASARVCGKRLKAIIPTHACPVRGPERRRERGCKELCVSGSGPG